MKRILIALAMAAAAMVAMAEPTFDQVQSMIGQKQYSSAAAGLEVIIQNHPTSAKAFYAMAQAQAGLGDLAKAKRALDKARGLDPELKFASADNVKSLEQAITPQVAKIEMIEPSHFWRNTAAVLIVLLAGGGFFYYRKKKQDDEDAATAESIDRNRTQAAEVNNRHDTYGLPAATRSPLKPSYSSAMRQAAAPVQPAYQPPTPQPQVINNYGGNGGIGGNGGSDMLTGVLVGNMIANSGSHHSHDTYVEREVIVERPVYRDTTPTYAAPAYEAPSRSSTWDDAPAKSSTWDDAPAKSSTWDDNSSSSTPDSNWSNDSGGSSSGDSGGGGDW